jgi:hypothetical protein
LQTVWERPIAEAMVSEEEAMGHTVALHLPRTTAATFLTPPVEDADRRPGERTAPAE